MSETSETTETTGAAGVGETTETTGAAGTLASVRAQFPVLARRIGARALPLVYLDSAATSLMPACVIEEIDRYERTGRSNIHRGIHTLAEESTDAYEAGREELAAFLNVGPESLVLTHGTTESVNLVARGWRRLLERPCGPVLVAEENHHANIVPWQMLAARGGPAVRFLAWDGQGEEDGLAAGDDRTAGGDGAVGGDGAAGGGQGPGGGLGLLATPSTDPPIVPGLPLSFRACRGILDRASGRPQVEGPPDLPLAASRSVGLSARPRWKQPTGLFPGRSDPKIPRQARNDSEGVTCNGLDMQDAREPGGGSAWYRALEEGPCLVALTHVSNVLGTALPVRRLVAEAHEAGAAVLLDCAQSFGHMPLDLAELDVDFAAASLHKAYGPWGLGFLWCKPERMAEMEPLMGGGGMVGRVGREGFTCAEGVAAFEGGTPAVSAVVGMRRALSFISQIGLDVQACHTAGLVARATAGLASLEGVTVLGGADAPRCSLVSFTLDGLHPHDLAAALDEEGIAVRAGHHCAMPLHQALGLPASTRASFAAYSTQEDVDALLRAMAALSERRGDVRTYRNRR